MVAGYKWGKFTVSLDSLLLYCLWRLYRLETKTENAAIKLWNQMGKDCFRNLDTSEWIILRNRPDKIVYKGLDNFLMIW
jgi:hypothetical protein